MPTRRIKRQMPLSSSRSRRRRIRPSAKPLKLTVRRSNCSKKRLTCSSRSKRPFLTKSTRPNARPTLSKPKNRALTSNANKSASKSTRSMFSTVNCKARLLTRSACRLHQRTRAPSRSETSATTRRRLTKSTKICSTRSTSSQSRTAAATRCNSMHRHRCASPLQNLHPSVRVLLFSLGLLVRLRHLQARQVSNLALVSQIWSL